MEKSNNAANLVYSSLGLPARSTGVSDTKDTAQLTREQLELYVAQLRDQLDREREQRQQFQLERDKIRTFLEMTRGNMAVLRTRAINSDWDIERERAHAQKLICEEKQKTAFLVYEHQKQLMDSKMENLKDHERMFFERNELENRNVIEVDGLKKQLTENETSFERKYEDLRMDLERENEQNRKKFECLTQKLKQHYDTVLQETKDRMDLDRATEICETEARKNEQIVNLMNDHKEFFSELKLFYNEITLNNLAVIKSLKDQLIGAKSKKDRLKTQLIRCERELAQTRTKCDADTVRLRELDRHVTRLQTENAELHNSFKKFRSFEHRYARVQWLYDCLKLRFESMAKRVREFEEMGLRKCDVRTKKPMAALAKFNSNESVHLTEYKYDDKLLKIVNLKF